MAVDRHQQAALMSALWALTDLGLRVFLLSWVLPPGQVTCTQVAVLVRVQGGREDSDSFFHFPKAKAQHKCQDHA